MCIRDSNAPARRATRQREKTTRRNMARQNGATRTRTEYSTAIRGLRHMEMQDSVHFPGSSFSTYLRM
eukprot:1287709-Lingulodinium_polyedra.AAC.1